MKYMFITKLVEACRTNNGDLNYKQQFVQVVNSVGRRTISEYHIVGYMKKLKDIREYGPDDYGSDELKGEPIPILIYDKEDAEYNRYPSILKDIINHILNKIKKFVDKFPVLCPMESVILMWIINIFNRSEKEFSISSLYHIMYCWDIYSYKLKENHDFDCKCKEVFNTPKTNTSPDKSIEVSIADHYNLLGKVEGLVTGFVDYVKDKFPGRNFKININQSIELKINENDKNNIFPLKGTYEIIAWSSDVVINVIIKPSFNRLNFNDVLPELITKSMVVKYIKPKEKKNDVKKKTLYEEIYGEKIYISPYEKFYGKNGKKVVSCIISLDSNPIFIDTDSDILVSDNHNKLIMKNIKNYIISVYDRYHKDIFSYITQDDKTIDSVYDDLKGFKVPDYIITYMSNMLNKYSSDTLTNTLSEEEYIHHINTGFGHKREIDKFIPDKEFQGI